jgi:hypothetical protein
MHRAPSFRRHTLRISLAVLFLAYPLVATAVAETATSPDGWGPYKFGTLRSELKPGEAVRPGKGPLELLDSATIGNQLYTVSVYFRGDPYNPSTQKVDKVQLHPELKKMDRGRCGQTFEEIAAAVMDKWGKMEPNTATSRLSGQVKSYTRTFDEGGSILRISEIFLDRCDVNVMYEAAPPKRIEGFGF